MRIGEREARRTVIEGRRQERDSVVTVCAIRHSKCRTCGRVRRVVRPLPSPAVVGIQMTLGVSAIGRLNRQIVVVIDVAVGAGRYLARRCHAVRVRERKTRRGVIKIRVLPGNGVVAVRTGGDRKYRGRRRVLRVAGLLPGGKVAARMSAVGRRNLQVVVSTHVATLAGNIRVPVGQREVDRRRGVVDACA